MRGVSVPCQENPSASARIATQPAHLALRCLGLDILGPFPRAQGGYRYLYVAIDKFTNWAEVELVHTIPARSAVKFIQGLVCHFGMPNRIITDNGIQFTSSMFRE
jgi:transposase InsO family protein